MNENKPNRAGDIIEWLMILGMGLIVISSFVKWWTG